MSSLLLLFLIIHGTEVFANCNVGYISWMLLYLSNKYIKYLGQ